MTWPPLPGTVRERSLIAEAALASLGGEGESWSQQLRALHRVRAALMQDRGLQALRVADHAASSRWTRLHRGLWWVLLSASLLLVIISAVFLLPSKGSREIDPEGFLAHSPQLVLIAAGLQLVVALRLSGVHRDRHAARLVSAFGPILLLCNALWLAVNRQEIRILDGGRAVLGWTVAAGILLLVLALFFHRTRPAEEGSWRDGVWDSLVLARRLRRQIPSQLTPAVAQRWRIELAGLEGEVGDATLRHASDIGPWSAALDCAVAANVPISAVPRPDRRASGTG